jgi:hypothetical protein
METMGAQKYVPLRCLETVALEIRERYEHIGALRKRAGEFAALDLRPFIVSHDGITYMREPNIPKELLIQLHDEAVAIAVLEHEFADRRNAGERLST